MIHKFTAENFYSIGEKVEVNFESSFSKAEIKDLYFWPKFGNKAVSKIMFVGGANASGKTNLLRVLAYLRQLIVGSIGAMQNNAMGFVRFIPYAESQPTRLSVEFSIDDTLYTYDVELNMQMILAERLVRKKVKTERATSAVLFTRIWQEDKYEVEVNNELSSIKALKNIEQLATDNKCASFISIFTNFDDNDGALRAISGYWNGVLTNVRMVGTQESNGSMLALSERAMARIRDNRELYDTTINILRKYDLGFDEIVRRKLNPEREEEFLGVRHVYDNVRFDASMGFESSGTQRLLILLEIILTALLNKSGGAAILDELDAFLHPDMYEEILELFMSKKTNPYGTQLIFSAQNYSIMSKLDKQQIILTEKDERGETEAWRLDEMKGVRNDQNYYAKYLAGAYGAVPRLDGVR